MKIRLAAALAASFILSACSDTDWSRGMSFVGLDDSEKAEPAPPPVVAQAVPAPAPAQTAQAFGVNPFCISVAKQDAERNAFDAATQQGVYTRSYQQCVAIFGNAAPE
jgi:hypothetical protein